MNDRGPWVRGVKGLFAPGAAAFAVLLMAACAPVPKLSLGESCRQVQAAIQPQPGRLTGSQLTSSYKERAAALTSLEETVADPLREPVKRVAELYARFGTPGVADVPGKGLSDGDYDLMRGLDQVSAICGG